MNIFLAARQLPYQIMGREENDSPLKGLSDMAPRFLDSELYQKKEGGEKAKIQFTDSVDNLNNTKM